MSDIIRFPMRWRIIQKSLRNVIEEIHDLDDAKKILDGLDEYEIVIIPDDGIIE